MQRNRSISRKNPYVKSGIPGHRAPGGRRMGGARRAIRLLLLLAGALAMLTLLVYGIVSLLGGGPSLVRINALPSYNIQAFGENVLYYDGTTLTCVEPNGQIKWRFTLGAGADYSTDGEHVVAWVGNQLYVLDRNGLSSFNDRMDSAVRFARIGDTYVAACLAGETETTATVRVMDHDGTLLENTAVDDLYVLDIGFFHANGPLMWVLSLDIEGTAPISNLTTYEPGKRITGAVDLNNKLVYNIYVHNNLLMLADTSNIRAYDYQCVEQTDLGNVLIYGWRVESSRQVGRSTTYALLEPMASAPSGATFSELRLVNNYTPISMRLLSPCFASGLNSRGVYAFGSNVIYHAAYGQKTFQASYLSYTLTDYICMLEGGRAVLVSGNDVFILKLPT